MQVSSERLMSFQSCWDELDINSKCPSATTFSNWASRGVKGVVLKTQRIGGRIKTSPKWLREFLDKVNDLVDA